jgi:hypothetical protein
MEIGLQIINVLSAEMFFQQIWKQIWNLIKQFTFCNKNTRGKTLFRAIHHEYFKLNFREVRPGWIFEHDHLKKKIVSTPGSGSAFCIRILIYHLKLMRIHADPDPSYPWFRINFFPDAKPVSVSAWHEAGDGYENFLCPRRPASWAGSRAGSPLS